ncbi:hypothetical protein CC80DRAFT_235080 [Byssothecium circinans]|uniref:Uncharacterized protein n=1 Tax=Byssothecium circinans TaxID=147558 RepID=A0A6A5U8Q0_9PLEO|nr:hypothetical protein CC80DRAFT_235080 [Byssothecium circinans]
MATLSTMTAIPTVTKTAVVPARGSRLIDADKNKAYYFPKLVVFGEVGSGAEVLSKGLKDIDMQVYDEAEVIKNHERDLPLWIEAAELRKAGQPYGKAEFDKFLGRYNIIIGTPATYFAKEIIEFTPYDTKFIVMKNVNQVAANTHRSLIQSPVSSAIDPKCLGKFAVLNELLRDEIVDLDVLRSSVGKKDDLLELDRLDSWKTICDHAGLQTPSIPFPEPSVTTTVAAVNTRWTQIINNVGINLYALLNFFLVACCAENAVDVYHAFNPGQKLNKMTVEMFHWSAWALFMIAIYIMNTPAPVDVSSVVVTAPVVIKKTYPPAPHLRKRAETPDRSPVTTRTTSPSASSATTRATTPSLSPPRQPTNGSPPRQPAKSFPPRQQQKGNQPRRGRQNSQNNGGRNNRTGGQKAVAAQKPTVPVNANGIRPARPVLGGAWGSFYENVRAGDRANIEQAVENKKKFAGQTIDYDTEFKERKSKAT